MVREITTYPTPLSVEYGIAVRNFDETLFALIEDLKDTINANNLQALAAFQIGSYFNVVVLKNSDDTFTEMINPRLISHAGSIETQEQTAYYPNLSAKLKRFEKISVVYQDTRGDFHTLQAEGDVAVTLQRKLDYNFGATFITKLSKDEKQRFEQSLEFGSDVGYDNYCPTSFVKDKIIKFINVIIALLFVVFVLSLFVDDRSFLSKVWEYQLYSSYFLGGMILFYIVYGKYESTLYKSCTSCQIGNLIGTASIAFLKLSVVMTLSFFFVR